MEQINKPEYIYQRGSAFFFILLGCALFAALSFAVVQTVRLNSGSGGPIGTTEKLSLTTSEIKQYLDAIKTRTAQLVISDGITETSLDFRNDVYTLQNGADNTDNTNSNCTDSSCRIFMPYNTDGMTPIIFTDAANTTDQSTATLPKNGHGQVHQIIINGVGSTAPDLVFLIHGIKADLCNYYNAQEGITTAYTNSTTLSSIGEDSTSSVPATFSGSFNTTNDFGAGATDFTGKKTFCAPAYSDGSDSRLAIWQVIKIR